MTAEDSYGSEILSLLSQLRSPDVKSQVEFLTFFCFVQNKGDPPLLNFSVNCHMVISFSFDFGPIFSPPGSFQNKNETE
jgi:hypothetical protein